MGDSRSVGAIRSTGTGAEAAAFSGRKSGVDHAERLKDPLSRERAEILAALALDQLAENEKADVRIAEPFSRPRDELDLGDSLPGRVGAVFIVGEGIIRNKTRAVAEKLVNRDRRLAMVIEFGHDAAQPVVNPQLAFLDQDHDRRRRGNRLRERRHVEDGVSSHRLGFRLDGP